MNGTEKETKVVTTRKAAEKASYQLDSFNLDKVEELETAIAPGGVGFGCGCKGIFGAYCG